VRFVSLAKPGAPAPRPEALQAEYLDTDTQPVAAPTSDRPGPVPISHAAASAKAAADGDETPSPDN